LGLHLGLLFGFRIFLLGFYFCVGLPVSFFLLYLLRLLLSLLLLLFWLCYSLCSLRRRSGYGRGSSMASMVRQVLRLRLWLLDNRRLSSSSRSDSLCAVPPASTRIASVNSGVQVEMQDGPSPVD
jgi:hypothetical protein